MVVVEMRLGSVRPASRDAADVAAAAAASYAAQMRALAAANPTLGGDVPEPSALDDGSVEADWHEVGA